MRWLKIALYVFFFAFFTGVAVTGILIYEPSSGPSLATASVEYLMRDAESRWLSRYSHSLLSGLFIVISLGYLALILIFQKGMRVITSAFLFLLLLGVEYFIGLLMPWGELRLGQNLWIRLSEDSFTYASFAHAIVIPLLLAAISLVVLILMRKAR